MMVLRHGVCALMLGMLVACGGSDDGGSGDPADVGDTGDVGVMADTGTGGGETDAAEGEDAAVDTSTGGDDAETDAEPVPTAPEIGEALDCGREGPAGGLSPGDELERHTFDRDVFPEAVCNDGTEAVFYYRPFQGEANRDRWVIQLQGGGGCNDPDSCARRWCSIDTNFGMQQMTSNVAPEPGINGRGVLDRRPENPVGDANHVFIRYCSSDLWSGTSGDLVIQTVHPRTEAEVEMRLHFKGTRIIDAVLDTLRQDGVPGVVHAQRDLTMPDLDDAQFVFFVGASAGGGGVIHNADRVGELLRANNTRCDANGCPLEYRVLVDSAWNPNYEDLDYDGTVFCDTYGWCDYPTFMMAFTGSTEALRQPLYDASCQAAHADTGDTWRCGDTTYMIRHHLTSPFFVRMGQTDSLISSGFQEAGFGEVDEFAALVREQLASLGQIQNTAHEADAIDVAPGWFGPTCDKHETLRSNVDTFGVQIRDADGEAYTMFDVIGGWLTGNGPSGLIATSPMDNICP